MFKYILNIFYIPLWPWRAGVPRGDQETGTGNHVPRPVAETRGQMKERVKTRVAKRDSNCNSQPFQT